MPVCPQRVSRKEGSLLKATQLPRACSQPRIATRMNKTEISKHLITPSRPLGRAAPFTRSQYPAKTENVATRKSRFVKLKFAKEDFDLSKKIGATFPKLRLSFFHMCAQETNVAFQYKKHLLIYRLSLYRCSVEITFVVSTSLPQTMVHI